MTGTRVHRAYCEAKSRCENQNTINYRRYGGRGIRFLWSSFEEFLAEMGMPPSGGTLERVDNNGHYEPGNCRWATVTEQANNRRSNHRLVAWGRTQTLTQWAREFAVHPNTLFN